MGEGHRNAQGLEGNHARASRLEPRTQKILKNFRGAPRPAAGAGASPRKFSCVQRDLKRAQLFGGCQITRNGQATLLGVNGSYVRFEEREPEAETSELS